MCASVINWNWHKRLMARLHATTTTDSRGYHRVYLESQLVHFIFPSCPSCALAEWSSWAFFTCLLTPLASQKVLVQCGHSFLAAVVAFSPSITDHWSKMQCVSCALCTCACMHASHPTHCSHITTHVRISFSTEVHLFLLTPALQNVLSFDSD